MAEIIINKERHECPPAVAAYIKELKAENARLEEAYQKATGVIAATDCEECKRHYEGEIKVRCQENREKNKLIDELNTELSGYRQNAIVFKPELMYTLKECEPKLGDWHNENPSYQNLQEIRYRAAKAEYDKIMKVLSGWGIKNEVSAVIKQLEHDICPICRYPIPSCQCMHDHGIDRSKRMEVVFSHLHLLTPEQQKHVVRLQSEMNISYEDSERDHVYWELMGKNKCGIKI